MKKASLSLETVVVAVIVILVLASLSYILISKGINPFARSVTECRGQCMKECEGQFPIAISSKGVCVDSSGSRYEDKYCCIGG